VVDATVANLAGSSPGRTTRSSGASREILAEVANDPPRTSTLLDGWRDLPGPHPTPKRRATDAVEAADHRLGNPRKFGQPIELCKAGK
jgi:hypothetical protein